MELVSGASKWPWAVYRTLASSRQITGLVPQALDHEISAQRATHGIEFEDP
jgi:hypothetical protein